MCPTNDAKRGTKRSIDDLESEEALNFGKLLWTRLDSEITAAGLSSTWHKRNYAELWQTTKQHPGETVETTVDSATGLSRPTENELARRAKIFIQKALKEEQTKNRLSGDKRASYSPIAVSKSSQRLHPGVSSALAQRKGDFFDNLAQAVRQKCEQQTYAFRVHIHQLSAMLRDADTKTHRLVQERDRERQARRNDAVNANNKIQRLKVDYNKQVQATESKHKKEVQEISSKHCKEKESIRRASEDAYAEIKRLKVKIQDVSSKLGREEQAHLRAITVAAEETQQRKCMAERHKKELQGLTSKHDEEKRSLRKETQDAATELNRLKDELQTRSQELEKERKDRRQLEDKNRALQKKIDRIMAVANDDNPVLV